MHLDANFWFPRNLMVCRALLPRISTSFVVANLVTHSLGHARAQPASISTTLPSRLRLRDCGNWSPRQVDGEDASFAGQRARIDSAVVSFDAPSAERETQAQARSIGASLFERAEEIGIPIRDEPPHSSSISMSTRSALAPTCSVTVVRGLVNLNAFCRRFPTTEPRTCRSASIATPSSTGTTVSVMPRTFASKLAAGVTLFDESRHQELLRFSMPCVSRTSASD